MNLIRGSSTQSHLGHSTHSKCGQPAPDYNIIRGKWFKAFRGVGDGKAPRIALVAMDVRSAAHHPNVQFSNKVIEFSFVSLYLDDVARKPPESNLANVAPVEKEIDNPRDRRGSFRLKTGTPTQYIMPDFTQHHNAKCCPPGENFELHRQIAQAFTNPFGKPTTVDFSADLSEEAKLKRLRDKILGYIDIASREGLTKGEKRQVYLLVWGRSVEDFLLQSGFNMDALRAVHGIKVYDLQQQNVVKAWAVLSRERMEGAGIFGLRECLDCMGIPHQDLDQGLSILLNTCGRASALIDMVLFIGFATNEELSDFVNVENWSATCLRQHWDTKQLEENMKLNEHTILLLPHTKQRAAKRLLVEERKAAKDALAKRRREKSPIVSRNIRSSGSFASFAARKSDS